MQITVEIIENLTIRNNCYHVPGNVSVAIERCLENDNISAITSEYERLLAEFNRFVELFEPARIEYQGALTLDAYTANYLCRNMFVPSIALRDLAYSTLFQDLPESLNVLDLGSGTGAVTLGLLSMFRERPLSSVSLSVTAVDSCAEALARQRSIIDEAGYDSSRVELREIDICNADDCINAVRDGGPYYLVFSANCFTEISHDNSRELIGRLPEVLHDNGAIIIAEPPRDYTLWLIKAVATDSRNMGLYVYYPCPALGCPYTWKNICWVWRHHDYEPPEITVNGQTLDRPREDLVGGWLILTKQNISIYDAFKNSHPEWSWGPISKEHESARCICCSGEAKFFTDDSLSRVYRRGHIVGMSDEGEIKEHYII